MERRVDLCLSVTDCHTMRQCHSSHWRNSGKAVEHLCCGPASSWIFTKTSFHAACCTNLLRPRVDRLEEPLRNDTLFPFYDICRTCMFVIAATSHCDWSTLKICPPLNWRQWNTSDGVNSYYAAPGIQALNGDNCCPCSSTYDHQPS